MSFDIPIFFDDSPFFQGDSFFRRQPRKRREPREESQQPNLFQTWTNYDPIFEEPREGRFAQPNYRNKPRREVPTRSVRRNEQDRDFEENEDIDDPEELSGVTGDLRDLRGLDGWDIPVEFVIGPSRRNRGEREQQRRPREAPGMPNVEQEQTPPEEFVTVPVRRNRGGWEQQRPQQTPVRHNVEEDQAQRQRTHKVVQIPKHGMNLRERTGNKREKDSEKKVDVQNESEFTEKADEQTRMESGTKSKPSDDDKSIDTNENKENEGDTEIPMQYEREQEIPMRPYREKSQNGRRLSRRLSQCDPPPLAEIKIARIKSILKKTDGIEEKIKEFDDPLQNKKYLYISETLMCALLDLDNVDSDGLDAVRTARREGVKTLQGLVEKLEAKLADNKINESSKQIN